MDENHPSIVEINKMSREHFYEDFDFKSIPENFVDKQIAKLSNKKATGFDQISPKILKLAKPAIEKPITLLINKSLETSEFPNSLKIAQVVPVHKKNSTLSKGNYRPVSVLPAISKFFERAVYIQITEFFDNCFNIFLSAFRDGYSCQDTLIRIVEDWRISLDDNNYVAAILMDLSKAFDCLPHDLLLLNIKAMGYQTKQ